MPIFLVLQVFPDRYHIPRLHKAYRNGGPEHGLYPAGLLHVDGPGRISHPRSNSVAPGLFRSNEEKSGHFCIRHAESTFDGLGNSIQVSGSIFAQLKIDTEPNFGDFVKTSQLVVS